MREKPVYTFYIFLIFSIVVVRPLSIIVYITGVEHPHLYIPRRLRTIEVKREAFFEIHTMISSFHNSPP